MMASCTAGKVILFLKTVIHMYIQTDTDACAHVLCRDKLTSGKMHKEMNEKSVVLKLMSGAKRMTSSLWGVD